MNSIHYFALAAVGCLAMTAGAQQTNSTLDRGDTLATPTPAPQNLAGWYSWKVTSPKNFAPAGTGPATPRLAYAVYPDRDLTGNVVLAVRRSIDGGRTWEPPVTAYTANTLGGEVIGDTGTFYETHLDVHAHGDDVYLMFLSNAGTANTGSDQAVWVVASRSQGLSWDPAVQLSNGATDVDEPRAAVASSGLSVCWLADPAVPDAHDLFFARAAYGPSGLAAAVPERNLTNHNGAFDVDRPALDAQDLVVHVAWLDDSDPALPQGVQQRRIYSSTAVDGGGTWSTRFAHSPIFGGAWNDVLSCAAEVDLPFVYTFQEDSASGMDVVYMDFGLPGSWLNNRVPVSNSSADVDDFRVDVEGGLVCVMWTSDDNGVNQIYYTSDPAGGLGYAGGTSFGTTAGNPVVTTSPNREPDVEIRNHIHDLDVNGGVICAVWEGCSFPEDTFIFLSHDGGQTFAATAMTSLGTCTGAQGIDTDEPFCAVTLNGDYNVIYADMRSGTANTNNQVFLTGGKYPRVRYDGATQTLTMDKVDPAEVGVTIAFPMLSAGTAGVDVPASLGIAGAGTGFYVGLTNDLWYNLMFASLSGFFRPVTGSGNATWTGIPNVTAILGFPIHLVTGTVDVFDPVRMLKSYTDPIILQ